MIHDWLKTEHHFAIEELALFVQESFIDRNT